MMTWNTSVLPSTLTANNATSTVSRSEGGPWSTAQTGHVLDSGVQRIRFKVGNLAAGANVGVGVVPVGTDTSAAMCPIGWEGAEARAGWCYMGHDGAKTHHSRTGAMYGRAIPSGADAAVLLDFPNKSISFELNGRSQGVAFTDLSGPVHPAACLYGGRAAVSLVSVEEVK
eukprot:GFYU01004246.1.p1 GENE.GFYU01004246.1~~GFYU01004246.1.p1  ORF type:complete len:171 (-),score=35.77 GFYU01004246.1:211-723(-)